MENDEMVIKEQDGEDEHHHHHHHDDDDCCCKDEHHHHHHHDECECEDEHHHHHHHHDDECDCEDEHHHHHHHDDECDCEDEHHHHHHHHDGDDCDCDDCVSGVSIVHHENALAGSFEIEADLSKEDADKYIKEYMLLIRSIVEKHEGVVGHIKSSVTDKDGHTAMYSLTDTEVFRVGEYDQLGKAEKIAFAAILYGLDEITLRSLLVVTKEVLL